MAVFPGTASPHPLPFLFKAKCSSCFCSSPVQADPLVPFLLAFNFWSLTSSLVSEPPLTGEEEEYGVLASQVTAVDLVGVLGMLVCFQAVSFG